MPQPQASRLPRLRQQDQSVKCPVSWKCSKFVVTFHRTAGQPVCSPRTRGWSQRRGVRRNVGRVLPAHAGMVPPPGTAATGPRSCSPRTRGWSPGTAPVGRRTFVLPAHAGMVPRNREQRRDRRAPRARGDGPSHQEVSALAVVCSPRTRGWFLNGVNTNVWVEVLPAHAGMVLLHNWHSPAWRCAPRARGMVPRWARRAPQSGRAPRAHAGMVPVSAWESTA